ncbi:hypothetical protein HHI36_024060 [Cryptolaemus montrouzieri]|uniref:Uncharacterized protein n=1 Tax=Cryptolaemus montrouzieri TaxID=559131 RepID=A0ABD2P3K0_9CUCU
MDLVFDCNRLAKDELTYELVIHGFEDVGTVESIRGRLRNVIKLERSVKRVDRTDPTEDTKLKERSQLSSKALTLLPKLKTRVRTLHTLELSIFDASLLNIRVDSDDNLPSNGNDEEIKGAIENSTPKPTGVNKGQSSTSFQVKSVSVTKWNLQF